MDMARGLRKDLTSYGDPGFSLFLRKAFIKAMGYSDDALHRPIVGITNTYSDYNPCHGNVPDLVEAVKRGVMLTGALPMVFPTISIHESFAHPTSMYLRNLMAMEAEEMSVPSRWTPSCSSGAATRPSPPRSWPRRAWTFPPSSFPSGPW
jgi:dihydroxy-acid dehydratase